MPDMISKDLGPVSGYAVAVAHGYTGTEAQWIEEVLKGTQNAQTATQKAAEAAQSANTASQKATEASGSAQTATQQASAAADSATAASGSETNAASSATTATQQATAASGSATAAAGSASAAAADRATVQNLKNTFENTTVPNAVSQVNTAGSTQVAAVEAKGQEVLDSIPSDYTALSAEVETLSETKADSNGTYDSLTSGSAEQLLSSDGVEDSVPYVFRQTCGGAEGVGTRVDETVVGGTICWNQRVMHGNFDSASGWSGGYTVSDNVASYTYTRDATFSNTISRAMNSIADHVYLISAEYKCTANNQIRARYPFVGRVYATTANTWQKFGWVAKAASAGTQFGVQTDEINGETSNYKNMQCFDLTAMFGTAIADQIYALETATTGAGVALFRSMFPSDFYAYNSGELMSVNAARKETTSRNLVPETGWKLNTTFGNNAGKFVTYAMADRSCIDGILLQPGTYTYLRKDVGVQGAWAFYDEDKNVVHWESGSLPLTCTITQPLYCAIGCPSVDYASYKPQIVRGSSATDFVPYAKHTYPLDSSLTLRGIPKLDSNNKLYYDGDIYSADGSVKRRYGEYVFTGNEAWIPQVESDVTKAYYISPTPIPDIKKPADNNGIATWARIAGLNVSSRNRIAYQTDTGDYFAISNSGGIWITNEVYANRASLTGKSIVYELATPTTETADPYQQIQVVDPLGTEEYVDAAVLAGTRDVAVPVGHNSLYMTDLRKKIEGIPGDFSKLLAPIETGYTASKAYAVNDFLIVNSQLYKVTAPIANAATITPGTNVMATTVGEVLSALLNS